MASYAEITRVKWLVSQSVGYGFVAEFRSESSDATAGAMQAAANPIQVGFLNLDSSL